MVTKKIISVKDAKFCWPGQGSFTLNISDLSLLEGETVLLLGDSGSGKSTLLSMICGTILTNSGQVLVCDTDLKTLSGATRDRFRAENIGVIFQQFNLLPFGTVEDNILLPLSFAPKRKARCPNPQEQVAQLCDSLGLPPSIISKKAATLSVGQQQRVAVARALIGAPPILIADEPTSSLDASAQENFLNLLFNQITALGSTLLMVSHDPRLATRFDRVLNMSDIVTMQRDST